MPRYNPLPETIRIISHNVNRSTIVIAALLNSVGATADIILIQEANIIDPQFAITNPDFTLIIPPCSDQTSNRTAAYIT
jgi:exonuclease III